MIKRCLKCGTVAVYPPRVRFCRHRKHGKNSYWCYGQLERVTETADTPAPVLRPQDVALKKLKAVERAIDTTQTEVESLIKQVAFRHKKMRKLAVQAARYSALAAMSDEQVAAQKQAALDKAAARAAARRTRHIEVTE